VLLTRTEIEDRINHWTLNLSDFAGMSDSLSNLKHLFVLLSDEDPGRIDQRALYLDILQRIRREKLPIFLNSYMDEARSLILRVTDPLELHNILVSVIKRAIKYKSTPALTVHALECGPEPNIILGQLALPAPVFTSHSPPPNVQGWG